MPQILDPQIIADYDRDGAVVIRGAFAPHWVELLAAGVEAFAVCLLWSFRNPVHEQRVVGERRFGEAGGEEIADRHAVLHSTGAEPAQAGRC